MMGRGEYTDPTTNGLITSGSHQIIPQFGQDDMKTTTITNREFVGDVYAPAAGSIFNPTEYPLNPGMSKLFTWLSQIAINYEEYAIKQLIVTYKSTVADFASTSGQVGQVIMATHYNPTSDSFASKEEMMLYEGGMSCKTTEHMQHGIECEPRKLAGNEYKYVRYGNLPLSEDLKEYDLGKLSLAIVGAPSTYAGQVMGELWVSYTVELRKPKVASGSAYNIKRDVACVPVYPGNNPATGNAIAPWQSLLLGTRNSGICTFEIPQIIGHMGPYDGLDDLFAAVPTAATGGTTTVQQLVITFADEFEGCVRVNFKRHQADGILGATGAGAIVRQLMVRSSDNITAGGQPCISRFADMPTASASNYGTRRWTHVHATLEEFPNQSPDLIPGSGDHSIEMELHLRIASPTGGKKNQLRIGFQHDYSTYHFWRCEVTQYNTFLSASDNGRSTSALLLQDINGNPFVWA